MSTENTIWRATALTLFPDAFPGVLSTSIIGGAEKSGIWQLDTVDIRDFSTNRHRSVDSPPSGGGPGMVLKPDVAAKACLLYTSPSPRDLSTSRMPSSA